MKYLDSKVINYRFPSTIDFRAIINLLSEFKLPIQDIEPDRQSFILAEHDGKIIGCAGFEAYGEAALFRSLAVNSEYRNLKIGKLLTGKVMALAHEKGIHEFYLLTNTADGFFQKQGWKKTDRKEVPTDIAKSSEFASICPSTAICMKFTY
jgi:N-acetylglutamate synthase-like GNAT family acetyltransferase